METLKSLFWYLASFFGFVRVWVYPVGVGGWRNGRLVFGHQYLVRIAGILRTKQRVIWPSRNSPLIKSYYSNSGSWEAEPANQFASPGKKLLEIKLANPVKGDALLFYLGSERNATVIQFMGDRWRFLQPPAEVSHFLARENDSALVEFRSGMKLEIPPHTDMGKGYVVMLDYLTGRISFAELLTAYHIAKIQQRQYDDRALREAIRLIELLRDACKSPYLAQARSMIEIVLAETRN